jgi:hypothetical protein
MTQPPELARVGGYRLGRQQPPVVHSGQHRQAADPAAGHPRRRRTSRPRCELTRHGDPLPVAVERRRGRLVEHLQARAHPVFRSRGVHGLHRAGTQRALLRRFGPARTHTKTGNAHLRTQLIESAWAYRHRPIIGTALRNRQTDLPADTLARSWTAQLRLRRRFRTLAARKNVKGVVVTAIAPELAGFLWAETTHWPGANDHTRLMSMTDARPSIGAVAAHRHWAGRRAGGVGPIPGIFMPPPQSGASSEGPRPAHRRHAVPIRERQSGGRPIHAAPTRPVPVVGPSKKISVFA